MAAGCTAVVKPSPYTPLQVLTLGELIDEAGLPPGVVNIVTGGDEASIELTTHPAVDIVSFTGSDVVGQVACGILNQNLLSINTIHDVVAESGACRTQSAHLGGEIVEGQLEAVSATRLRNSSVRDGTTRGALGSGKRQLQGSPSLVSISRARRWNSGCQVSDANGSGRLQCARTAVP
ncbi:aldehyde dehydrogenase family protein [Nocardia cyriacigeorgica]|uniref:Aldehyde dehydrogenase family protein n=1 Tax=Nocardia cyriacigeorgica TaxID=135487 RepID=A0A6P1D7T3_9NOCA|nr:aldehyde dehydrogenase family protein [Nocardia cyriacigeorgica]NEW45669.1 aldehyde dehydrogenase family protein [Nocardia cyriacigeorgica]